MPIDIREATADEGNDLALLRFRWHAERHPSDRYDIVDQRLGFARWWSAQGGRFRAVVAADETEIIGMGFLALVERVPVPGELDRHRGDVQSMYVVPEHRGGGVGSAILRALVDLAREAGCGRVEVHSGRRAIPFYERAGFEHVHRLMNLDLGE